MNTRIFYAALFSFLFTSCIKDEPLNMECDILSAWVEGEEYTPYFYHETDMRIEDIASNQNKIAFVTRSLTGLPKIRVYFSLTPGATIEPASGSEQDFSDGPIIYTVTSEDGAYTRQYAITFQEAQQKTHYQYDFEHFELGKYYNWYEIDNYIGRQDIWATGNPGFAIANAKNSPEDYPSVVEKNGFRGNGVRLTTCDAGSLARILKKPIAAGNLYLGKFNTDKVMSNSVEATEMGIPFAQEPVKVTGYYKYRPGERFTDKNMTVVPNRTDSASIYAVLYPNKDNNGKSIVLNGGNVLTHPSIVRIAQVEKLPATDQWTRFEMTFKGNEHIDGKRLYNRGYNLALVFSSSKTGNLFEGAIGSTLYIDNVEIFTKEQH